jgi:protein arginine N-methyltransferase 1
MSKKGSSAPVVRSDSLLCTEEEMQATSKSMYGDHKARVSSNVQHIHDRVRIQAYSNAIQSCMKGKNVLHLGCGMGLITMIAARSMAKLVVGLDTSEIIKHSTKVAADNKLTNLTFLQGKASEVKFPVEKFDVIICEWMGAFLTNDSIIKELLYCKKHHLVEGGIVCPDSSSLHITGISDYQYHHDSTNYWDNVYGFSMQAMKPLVMKEASSCHIPKQCLAMNTCMVHSVDFNTIAKAYDAATTDAERDAALSYKAPFTIKANRKTTIHFLTFYMDCIFNNPVDPGANFAIGFTPGGRNTFLEVSVPLADFIPVNAGDKITGEIYVRPSTKPGTILIDVTANSNSAVAAISTSGSYNFTY